MIMEKPARWMTLQELHHELERTRPAWGPWMSMATLPVASFFY
jgi:hypothetical protein